MSSDLWTADRVRARLLAMGDTLRAWRPHEPLAPRGHYSIMPHPIRSAGELFAAQVERVALVRAEFAELDLEPTQARLVEEAYGAPRAAPPQPSARAIDEMTEAIGWFRFVEHPVARKSPLMRKVVWEWALNRNRRGEPIEPARIAETYGVSRDTVRLWIGRAAAMIATALNERAELRTASAP